MVRHAPIHRRSDHSDIAICCGRNVRGSSLSTSVVPLSNQVTTLNHKRFKGFKMFSDGHLEIRRKSATPRHPSRNSNWSDRGLGTLSVFGLMRRKAMENMPGRSNTWPFLLPAGWTRWSRPSRRNALALNTGHSQKRKRCLDSRGIAWPKLERVWPRHTRNMSALLGGLNRSTQHFILKRKDGVYNGSKISSRFHRGGENGIMGPLAAWGVLEGDWTSIW